MYVQLKSKFRHVLYYCLQQQKRCLVSKAKYFLSQESFSSHGFCCLEHVPGTFLAPLIHFLVVYANPAQQSYWQYVSKFTNINQNS